MKAARWRECKSTGRDFCYVHVEEKRGSASCDGRFEDVTHVEKTFPENLVSQGEEVFKEGEYAEKYPSCDGGKQKRDKKAKHFCCITDFCNTGQQAGVGEDQGTWSQYTKIAQRKLGPPQPPPPPPKGKKEIIKVDRSLWKDDRETDWMGRFEELVRQKKINDIPADAEPEIPGHRGKKDKDKTAEEKAEEEIEWDYLKYAETPEEWEEMHRTTTEDANGIACMTALAIALTTLSF